MKNICGGAAQSKENVMADDRENSSTNVSPRPARPERLAPGEFFERLGLGNPYATRHPSTDEKPVSRSGESDHAAAASQTGAATQAESLARVLLPFL